MYLQCIIVSFLSAVAVAAASSQVTSIGVTYDSKTNQFSVIDDINSGSNIKDSLAYGTFTTDSNGSGWNYLDVSYGTSSSSSLNALKSKALGYVEGYLTCNEMQKFYYNFVSDMFGKGSGPGVKTSAFLIENYDWMKKQVLLYGDSDSYWYEVGLYIQQMNGLLDGYKDGCPNRGIPIEEAGNSPSFASSFITNPSMLHLLAINAWGDLYQIAMKFYEPGHDSKLHGNRLNTAGDSGTKHNFRIIERCSALYRIADDYSDIYFGHNTWDSYESMGPRILKHYTMDDYDVHFSSSPAVISSIDDFFIIKSDTAMLSVIETTNSLYNVSMLHLIEPTTVLSYMRAVTSHKTATDGYNWAVQFSKYQSGTYINQWMIADLKLFVKGSQPKARFFTVFEEVPGTVHYEDQTNALIADKYWGSYNVPYYSDINALSGNERMCNLQTSFCHETAPRANIFRQHQSGINTLQDMQMMMQYNQFQTDPLSLSDSCNAIAARGDLEINENSRGGFGALDAKISSYNTVMNYYNNDGADAPLYYAKLGPTTDDQVPFCWDSLEDEAEYSHIGQPNCYDYKWSTIPYTTTTTSTAAAATR